MKINRDDRKTNGDAVGVGNFFSAVIDDAISDEQRDFIFLDENKERILPKKMQGKAAFETLRNGTLFLKSKSAVWKAELAAIKTDILIKCNSILGRDAVKSIRVV